MTSFRMIRLSVYLFLLVFIFNLLLPYSSEEIAPEIKPHYDEFMALTKQYCNEDQYFHPKFKIEFSDLTNNVIGLCSLYPNRYRIQIDRKFWKDSTDLQRFQLIAHELTHCILSKDHVDNDSNYMASSYYDISKEELYNQIKDVLKDKCK